MHALSHTQAAILVRACMGIEPAHKTQMLVRYEA